MIMNRAVCTIIYMKVSASYMISNNMIWRYKMRVDKKTLLLILGILIVLVASCAANNTRYDEVPAGFWAGLWHGLIIVVAFIISLFTDSVSIYEVNNSGGWYNFGYVFGLMIALSHGGMWEPVKKKKAKSAKEAEWEEIGIKVEEKVKTGIQNWVNETNQEESEWEEIGKKVEEKIKRELRNWADK